MVANLPGSEEPDIREYLYVDEGRVRTLLAQMVGGSPDTASSESTKQWTAGLSYVANAGRESSDTQQETRSLADLHVALLEDNATALGRLADLSDVSARSKNWLQQKLHQRMAPGALVRVTASTRLINPARFSEDVEQFQTFSDDEEFTAQIKVIMTALYGDALVLRIQPCTDRSECRFTGIVTDPSEYLGNERNILFSRFGTDSQEWTTLFTVTRIPGRDQQPRELMESLKARFDGLDTSFADASSRNTVEEFIEGMAHMMESLGLCEAPAWPTIGILPLAIYRHVPPAAQYDDLVADDDG